MVTGQRHSENPTQRSDQEKFRRLELVATSSVVGLAILPDQTPQTRKERKKIQNQKKRKRLPLRRACFSREPGPRKASWCRNPLALAPASERAQRGLGVRQRKERAREREAEREVERCVHSRRGRGGLRGIGRERGRYIRERKAPEVLVE